MLDGKTKFQFDNVLTTNRLSVASKHFATEEQIRIWPHLNGIHLLQNEDRRMKLLIGMDHAVKTPLGWTVCGPISETSKDEIDNAYINFARSDQDDMNKQLERIYNSEFGDLLVDTMLSSSIED